MLDVDTKKNIEESSVVDDFEPVPLEEKCSDSLDCGMTSYFDLDEMDVAVHLHFDGVSLQLLPTAHALSLTFL